MKMKIMMVFMGLAFATGVHSQERLAPPNDPNTAARSGQAEIIINAGNSERAIAVWINGTIVAHVPPNSSEKIIVHNGQNLVEAADTTVSRNQWRTGIKRQITVNSNSDSVTIGMAMRYGALLSLNIQGITALGGGPVQAAAAPVPAGTISPVRPSTPPPAHTGSPEMDALENAVYRAAWIIIENLPSDSTVAVLNISSPVPGLADIIIGDLEFYLWDTKKFTIVERRTLDAVREEARFQYSGEVDDSDAVAIGKMAGASIVVTGSVNESGTIRRLTTKALDVQSGRVVAMASERY